MTGRLILLCGLAVSVAACSVLRPGTGAPDYEANQAQIAIADALRDAERATVRIRNVGCGGVATGSGVVVGPGQLLTNAHVIAGADTVEISLWDGTTLEAAIVGSTQGLDLARVDVDLDLTEGAQAEVAKFATADPAPGADVYVFGFPGGGEFEILNGEVLGYTDVGEIQSMIMSNKVLPGNSGGPVFDATGGVVGLVRAQLLDTGDGVAIPISTVTAALAEMQSAPSGTVPPCDAFQEATAVAASRDVVWV